MNEYLISGFSQKCKCGGSVKFKIVIGEDIDDILNELGFLSHCDECDRSYGLASSISEAYSESQIDVCR